MCSGLMKLGQWDLPVIVPELGGCLSGEAPALQREPPRPLAPLPAFPPLLLWAGVGSSLASLPSQPVPLGKSCDGCWG